jgi:hypothetical protein
MKTMRDRALDSQQLRREEFQRQIDDGSLVIREMTAEERLRYPPPVATPTRGNARKRWPSFADRTNAC